MGNNAADWVAGKLAENGAIDAIERADEDFLVVTWRDGYAFPVAVLGVKNLIERSDVEPLFAKTVKPSLVVNVPSRALWSGDAIRRIHAAGSSFGALGDVARAAATGDAGSYRDKNMRYFIKAMEQHSNVSRVSYIFDRVLEADRRVGRSLSIAVIDAYNMSAEDVRNAKDRFGRFDVVAKSSGYGSITYQAEEAAKSMGAEALTFGDLMRRLSK